MYFPFRSPIGGGALPHTAKTYWEYGGGGMLLPKNLPDEKGWQKTIAAMQSAVFH